MKRNLNLVVLDGFVATTPEIKELHDANKVATFNMGVERASKGDSIVDYFKIETWNEEAESCVKYLKKGSKITLQGYLKQDKWQTPQGENRQGIKVVGNSVRFD